MVVYVNVQGVGPVKATLISPEPPLQIGEVPVITAVFLLTVTVALVEISFGVAVHLESLKAVIEYVVVTFGDTLNVYGLVIMPVTVTGVVPSV